MKHRIQQIASVLVMLVIGLAPATYAQASTAVDVFAVEHAPDDTPAAYTLSAAYPNPFNPTTTFSLSVRERQQVRVWVHNMLGQPVAELYQGTMQAGETRTFTFNAESLPSGIYFYRVTGERFTSARQITLIK